MSRVKLNQKNLVERKNINLTEAKLDSDTPGFEGYGSTFGNTDLQGDIVQKGAFRKTISENNGVFPLLSQHDHTKEIGLVTAREDDRGLFVEGKFHTDDDGNLLELAREEYFKMKRRQEAGRPMQMSIGYRAINPKFKDGKRILDEVALAELSVVTFPANTEAVTTSVKAALEQLADRLNNKDFQGEFEHRARHIAASSTLHAAVWTLGDILEDALYMRGDDEITAMLDQLDTDLDDFSNVVKAAIRSYHGVDSKAAREDPEHPDQESDAKSDHSEDGAAKDSDPAPNEPGDHSFETAKRHLNQLRVELLKEEISRDVSSTRGRNA